MESLTVFASGGQDCRWEGTGAGTSGGLGHPSLVSVIYFFSKGRGFHYSHTGESYSINASTLKVRSIP